MQNLHDLPGYRHDMLKLCSTFWIFGYDLRVYVNLTAEQMEQTTQTLAQETENDVSIFKGYASLFLPEFGEPCCFSVLLFRGRHRALI